MNKYRNLATKSLPIDAIFVTSIERVISLVLMLACGVIASTASNGAVADVSLGALDALEICDEAAFQDPISPCYGLEGVLGKKRSQVETTVVGELGVQSKGKVACDGPETKTFTMRKGYLSDEIARLAEYCGWTFIWKARRNNRVLDWRIPVPYTVAFKTLKNGLASIITPYKGVLAVDLYVDVKVLVVSIGIDRT